MYAVYQITENKIPIYVGVTTQTPFKKRWVQHLKQARRGSQQHVHLRMRSHKTSSFEWSVIEEGLDEVCGRKEREPYWISLLKPVCNHTRGGEGGSRGSGHWNDVSKQKEFCRQIGMLRKGRKNTIEHIMAVVDAKSQLWELVTPVGERLSIKNLNKFCREKSLDQGALTKVSQGKRQHHRGWKCKKLGTSNKEN